MTKTRLEVVQQAHRRLGVLSVDEEPTDDQFVYASDTLDAVFEECKTVQGMAFTWALDAVPDAAFLALSNLLAVEIAPHYEVAAEPRHRAMGRLRAYAFPDDRPDERDSDEDGIVSEAEENAGKRAAYY